MKHSPLLIGIGGAGAGIASHVHAALGGSLALINAAHDIPLADAATSGIALPCRPRGRRNVDDIASSPQLDRAVLEPLFEGASQIFLFAGLGGAVGSGATPAVARVALQCGYEAAAFVTIPLAVEKQATVIAEEAVGTLRALSLAMAIHDHERAIGQPANAGLGLVELLALSSAAALAFTREHLKDAQ